MKLFTRCFIALALLAAPLASAIAATFTVTVGNNFYSPLTVNIQTGDVVRFVWQAGVHPTVAENGTAWAPFTPSASRPTTDITFTTAGPVPYYCTLHAAPGQPEGAGRGRPPLPLPDSGPTTPSTSSGGSLVADR